MTDYLLHAMIYLGAATIAVPVARLLGLGSVLGYLIAGVIIGPLTGLVVDSETETLQHFAEFGVVMMLFLVGLELEPSVMWSMRRRLVGLGGMQVVLTVLAVAALALVAGVDWRIALAAGLILASSSTAIVLQTFDEKGLARTEGGRAGFSVLLFQDLAVIPIIALLPLLALPELVSTVGNGLDADQSLVADLPDWLYGLVLIGSIGIVVVGGHYLSGPIFRFVARSGLREAFTTTALALVVGIAALMGLVGLSPALGAFLAGMVLANSEFRHELEANIEPFKGLLLGLFFITVGAGIRFDLLREDLGLVLGLTLGIMLLKAAILFGLALVAKLRRSDGWLFTLSLAQAGEFGFVLLGYSQDNDVLDAGIARLLALVIALSMFLTPMLFIVFDKVIVPRYQARDDDREPDDVDDEGQVIIAGVGRFGQIVNRLLLANDVPTVVLDRFVGQVERMSQIQMKTYYGDASRPGLLQTAGIANASALVIAIDDYEGSVEMTKYVKHAYPEVFVLARAFDRGHQYLLREAGADYIVKETYYSALELGGETLKRLGLHPFVAQRRRAAFERVEECSGEKLYQAWLEREAEEGFGDNYVDLYMEVERVLDEAMKKNRDDSHDRAERGWTPPPKNYLDDFEGD